MKLAVIFFCAVVLTLMTYATTQAHDELEYNPDVFDLMQLKAFSEISTFSQTYFTQNPACQPLVALTEVKIGRFHDETDKYDINIEYQRSKELAKKLECDEENEAMWRRLQGLYNTFNRVTQKLVKDQEHRGKQSQRWQEAQNATTEAAPAPTPAAATTKPAAAKKTAKKPTVAADHEDM